MEPKYIRYLGSLNHYDREPVICVDLDLDWIEEQPFTLLPSFGAQLFVVMPSLAAHSCVSASPCRFLERLSCGTSITDVLEHISMEIQQLAGIEVGCVPPRESKRAGGCRIAYRYREPRSGLYAFRAAREIVESLLAEGSELTVEPYVAKAALLYREHPSRLAAGAPITVAPGFQQGAHI